MITAVNATSGVNILHSLFYSAVTPRVLDADGAYRIRLDSRLNFWLAQPKGVSLGRMHRSGGRLQKPGGKRGMARVKNVDGRRSTCGFFLLSNLDSY